jgi:hypothetical protein
MIEIPGCAVPTARKITEPTAEFPHTDQLTDRSSTLLGSTLRKEGRGYMPRRHFAMLAAAAMLALTTITTALVLPLTTANAGTPAVKVTQSQDTSPAAQTLAHDALVAQRTEAAAREQAAAIQMQLALTQIDAHQKVQTPMWECIRQAESNGRYELISGAYGILLSTWNAFSSTWSPYGSWNTPGEAPAYVQDLVAYHLYEVGGGYGGWHNRCTGY